MSTTTTPIDRAAINRRNAQKSTGPRTPEGKSRSRFNAVKHGMTAKTLVLPGEDADVLQQRIEAWTTDLQPQNEVEQFLVERSVQFSWQLERADRAELARLSSLIHGVPAAEASRQQEEAAALGRRLLSGRNVTQEANLQSQLLSLLVPGRKSQTAQPPSMSSTTPRPSSCASNPRRPAADGCSTAGASSAPSSTRARTGSWTRRSKRSACRECGR